MATREHWGSILRHIPAQAVPKAWRNPKPPAWAAPAVTLLPPAWAVPAVTRGCSRRVVTDQSCLGMVSALGLCLPQLSAIGAASWLPDPACSLLPLPAASLPTLQAAEPAAGLPGSCCGPGEVRRIKVSRLVSPVATLERPGLSGN